MSYEIRGNPAGLEASANAIEQHTALIHRELQSVHDLLMTLRRTFVGQRAAGFFQQYDTAYQDATEMEGVLRALTAEMRAVAQRLRAADQG
jgi:WXG100 family type VII secretion target